MFFQRAEKFEHGHALHLQIIVKWKMEGIGADKTNLRIFLSSSFFIFLLSMLMRCFVVLLRILNC